MATPLEGTVSASNAIARVKWDHDAIIDFMLANPALTQNQLAKHFGYTAAWLSRIVNSDAFNARLAARRTEVIDQGLLMSMDEKLKGLASQSLEIIAQKLEQTGSPELAFKSLELTTKALGYGARQQNIQQQTNYVVALPGKVESVEAWSQQFGNGGKAMPTVPFVEVVGEGK